MKKRMKAEDNNLIWKQSIEIFGNLVDLPINEALKQVNHNKDLDQAVKKKIFKLFAAMNKDNSVIDSLSSGDMFQHLKSLSDLTGTIIDNYKITELIDVGGMSSIYKAYRIDTGVQKPVAIKVMSLHKSKESITFFNREQKALSKLNHPNIVSFLHGGHNQDEIYYLVMEYIDGAVSLKTYVENQQLKPKKIVKMFETIANAMGFAHEHLIIHGDLKGDNILVDTQGNIKIIDFGIGAFTYQKDSIRMPAYTPEIASPEQRKGDSLTTKTDVFSLAATLLQLLIKENPLPLATDKYDEKADEIHVLNKLTASTLDQDLSNILIKALRTDSDKRYFSMFDFANDLNKWGMHRPISATKNTKRYVIKKFIKRKPGVSLAVIGFAFFLIGAFIIIKNYATDAQLEADKAKTTLNFMTKVLSQADPAHLDKGNTTIKQAFKIVLDQPDSITNNIYDQINIWKEVTIIFEKLALYSEAANIAEKIHQSYSKKEGRNSKNALYWQYQYATYYQDDGEYKKGLNAALDLIKRLDENKLEYDVIRLNALNVIIKCYLIQFYNKDADKYRDIALKLIQTGNIKDYESIGRIYNSFAVLSRRQNQFELSEQYYKQSLINIEKSLGKSNIAYATILSGFGKMHLDQKNYKAAKPYLLEAIELVRKFDPNSHVLAQNISQYSNYLFKTGQYQSALTVLDEASQLSVKRNHKFILLAINHKQFQFNSVRNQVSKALKGMIDTVNTSEELYERKNHIAYIILVKFALLLMVIDENDFAQEVLIDAINYYEEDPERHQRRLTPARAYQGINKLLAGDIDQAISLYEMALKASDVENKSLELQLLGNLLSKSIENFDSGIQITDPKKNPIPNHTVEIINANFLAVKSNDMNAVNCDLSDIINNSETILWKKIFYQHCLTIHSAEKLPEITLAFENLTNEIKLTKKIFSKTYHQEILKILNYVKPKSR